MRLIDADALKATFGMKNNCSECGDKWKACHYNRIYHPKMDFCKWIDDAPTVQLEQPKTGKWIAEDDMTIRGRCSVCGWEAIYYETDVFGMDYCPNCGARMEEIDE